LAVDARLNLVIGEVIKNAGGQVLVQRSGYANFINTMSAKKLLFGCENSGHAMYNFAWRGSRQFVYGDAIIQILFILQYLSKKKIKLSDAIKPFTDNYKISGELNFPAKNFDALAAKIKKTYSNCKISELDGVSVWSKKNDWFFNVRPSHTEPLVRVNIEAKDDVTVELVKNKLLVIMR
jgi:phosphomannomutase